MSMIKPVANQRRSVGMMEIMASRMGRFAGIDRRVTWPPAKPLDGFCGVLFGIAENWQREAGGCQSAVLAVPASFGNAPVASLYIARSVVFAWPRPRARRLPHRRWRRSSMCRCSPALAFQPSR